ncbi:unnamed protein product [Symbiodinium pilosum]|uniref:NYN domain-containing protein n=1 Tax=Symbiodinium pilosum TaxID=2952 RepID=A0A812SF49_SYMPI|nr:unnamed protein product [Symbiodinium pilosum]
MSELEKMGLAVHTTVFAPPGRGTNRKWSQFFQQSKITFHPVKRNSNHGGEANDNEIVKALQTCTKTCSFALLTSDFDFLGVVQQAAASNKKMFVFIPAQKRVVIDRYRSAGVQVYKLQPRIDRFPRVTAMLHQNGEGQVQLGDPCRPYDSSEKVKVCTGFLQDLGYVSAACREYLVHATTKFWLSNNLGSLTVFPQQLAIEEVWQLLRDQGGKKPWKNYKHDMAFVLPMTSVGKPTKKQLNKFGSALARRVFMGGGPCMLQDSTLLVSQALRQLGYLDEDMNADLFEAMLVFINCTDHRFALRKQLDAVPTHTDTAAGVAEKLRRAFLSHLTSGQWRVAPKDTNVRSLLHRQGFLSTVKAAPRDVFHAMARYARRHRLPDMKTYNGLVFRILDSLESNPTKTGVIEIRP